MNAHTAPVGVLIAGGGVAALEALLALRDLGGDRVQTTLLAPEREFRYRPASVAMPFGRGRVERYPLADAAAAAGARFALGSVLEVDTAAHRVVTDTGERRGYDVLVIACGARRIPVLRGAIAFGGEDDTAAVADLLDEIRSGAVKRVVFALPRGASWALPLYELALLTAAEIAEHHVTATSLHLVTPEDRPLAQFGGDVSVAVGQLLGEQHIQVLTSTYPAGVYPGRVMLIPHATIEADRVVCIPAARGVPIVGVPADEEGLLPTDDAGRVRGVTDVYAAGDITAYPIKQGGIAAQQADLVAQVIARRAGAPVTDPAPFQPVLRGLLMTGGRPRYLVSEHIGGTRSAATVSTDPLWTPGAKIAARYLEPYLAAAKPVEDG
jgi:sulfide:quinone oxidoreductase